MGPVAIVLLSGFSEERHLQLSNFIKQHTKINEQKPDFWDVHLSEKTLIGKKEIKNLRPFLITFQMQNADLEDLDYSIIGFKHSFQLELAAMCNDKIDHQLLAELCIVFAKMFDGLINLNGAITPPQNEVKNKLKNYPYVSAEEAIAYSNTISGINHIVRYGTDNEWFVQIIDVEYLQNWLLHKDFRMIK